MTIMFHVHRNSLFTVIGYKMRSAVIALLLGFVALSAQADEPLRHTLQFDPLWQKQRAAEWKADRDRLNLIFDYPMTRKLGLSLGRMLAEPDAWRIAPQPTGDLPTPPLFWETVNSLTIADG